MAAGLVIGNVILLIVMNRRRVGQAVIDAAAENPAAQTASYWLLARSATGYGSHVALSTTAVLLPASSITILNLANKIVTAISTTFTNAMLPALLHRNTQTSHAAHRFLRTSSTALVAFGGVLVAAVSLIIPDRTVAAIILAGWLVGSSAAAVAQRTAYRFLPARTFVNAMFWSIVVVVAVLIVAHTSWWHLNTLLIAYAILDLGTAAVLLWSLKDRRMTVVLVVVAVAMLPLAALS
jgi:hypothetical protein